MKSAQMKSVPRIEAPTYSEIRNCCGDKVRLWGGLGYCKDHTPYITPRHMGYKRYLRTLCNIGGKIMVSSVLPFIIKTCVLIALILMFVHAIGAGIDRQDLVACNTYHTFSQKHPHFYMTAEQKARCDGLGVTVGVAIR